MYISPSTLAYKSGWQQRGKSTSTRPAPVATGTAPRVDVGTNCGSNRRGIVSGFRGWESLDALDGLAALCCLCGFSSRVALKYSSRCAIAAVGACSGSGCAGAPEIRCAPVRRRYRSASADRMGLGRWHVTLPIALYERGPPSSRSRSARTSKPVSVSAPNEVIRATSMASRPRPTTTRPTRAVLFLASNVCQRPSR